MIERTRHPPHVYKVVIATSGLPTLNVVQWIGGHGIVGRVSWYHTQYSTTVYLDNDGDFHKLCNDFQDHILTIGPGD